MFWSKSVNIAKKKIIIIGGGLTGLCAGIHALNKGHEVIIIEKEKQVGGKFITSKYNTFKDFPKYINGKVELFYLLKEIGIDCNKYLIANEKLVEYVNLNQEMFYISNDLDYFKQMLQTYSINDDSKIKELISLIENTISLIKTKGTENKLLYYNENNCLKYENKLLKKLINKIDDNSIEQYINNFNSITIKELLSALLPNDSSMSNLILLLAYHFNKDTIILKSDIIDEMTQKFYGLSGKILLNKSVKELVFDKMNHIQKVILDDNSIIEGDYFISTTDPYYTYEKLLKRRFNNRKFYLRYEDFINYKVDSRQIYSFTINKEFKFDNIVCQTNKLKINTTIVNKLRFIKGLDNNTLFCEIEQNYNDYDYLKILEDKKGLNVDNHQKNIKEIIKVFKYYFSDYSISYKESMNMIDLKDSFRGAMKGFIDTPKGKAMIVDGAISGLNNMLISSSWLRSSGGVLNALVEGKFCITRLEKVIQNEKK